MRLAKRGSSALFDPELLAAYVPGVDQDSVASFGNPKPVTITQRVRAPKATMPTAMTASRRARASQPPPSWATPNAVEAKTAPAARRNPPVANSLKRLVQRGKRRRRAIASSHVAAITAKRISSACRKDIRAFIGNEWRPSESRGLGRLASQLAEFGAVAGATRLAVALFPCPEDACEFDEHSQDALGRHGLPCTDERAWLGGAAEGTPLGRSKTEPDPDFRARFR